jgi:hemin uptake protein HemP
LILQAPTGRRGHGEKGADKMNSHNPDAFRHRYQRMETQAPGRFEVDRTAVRTVSSNALFAGSHEIGIEHHGSLYRLKITRQGKLILNK